MSMFSLNSTLDWAINRRRRDVRLLAIERARTQLPLWKKTWLSAAFTAASIAGIVTVMVVKVRIGEGTPVISIVLTCAVVGLFSVATLMENISTHNWSGRAITYMTDDIRRLDQEIIETRAELAEQAAKERDERNLPSAVDALLILLAAEAGDGNPKVTAITGPRLSRDRWAEFAAAHDWDDTTTTQLRDANAALHRARRS